MLHDREVNQLEDFLGSIAGVYDLLMYFIFFVFGSYIDFISRVKWIKSRYRFVQVSHGDTEVERKKHELLKAFGMSKQDGKLDLSKLSLTQFYFRNESYLRFIICCIKRTEKERNEKKLIDKGSEQLEEEFNYKNLIDRLRLCQYETNKMVKKNVISYLDFETDYKLNIYQDKC